MTRRPPKIAVVRLDDAAELAEAVGAAVGGRAAAVQLLQAALDYLAGTIHEGAG